MDEFLAYEFVGYGSFGPMPEVLPVPGRLLQSSSAAGAGTALREEHIVWSKLLVAHWGEHLGIIWTHLG